MIPKVAAIGHSFQGAFQYYLHDKRQDGEAVRLTTERVGWTAARNLISDEPYQAKGIMIATAHCAAALKKQAGHSHGRNDHGAVFAYSLAWHPDEKAGLTKEEMLRAADSSLKMLKAEKHQAFIVCHTDEAQPHVHVIVNRVHPQSGLMLNLWQTHKRFDAWALAYEEERGKIYTPKRLENRKHREHVQEFGRAAKPPRVKAPTDRPESKAALLRGEGEALKIRQKEDWKKFAVAAQEGRQAIRQDYAHRIEEAKTYGGAAYHFRKQEWKESHKQKADARDRMGRVETGYSPNALRVAHTEAAGHDTRLVAYAKAHKLDTARLREAVGTTVKEAVKGLHDERQNVLAQFSQAKAAEHAALIVRQNQEQEDLRAAWRALNAERGHTPKARASRDEGKGAEMQRQRKSQPEKVVQWPVRARQRSEAGVHFVLARTGQNRRAAAEGGNATATSGKTWGDSQLRTSSTPNLARAVMAAVVPPITGHAAANENSPTTAPSSSQTGRKDWGESQIPWKAVPTTGKDWAAASHTSAADTSNTRDTPSEAAQTPRKDWGESQISWAAVPTTGKDWAAASPQPTTSKSESSPGNAGTLRTPVRSA